MSDEKEIPLGELVDGELTVYLPSKKKTYPLHPVDGFGYQMLAQMTDETSTETMYKIATKALMGQLTPVEVFGDANTNGLSAYEVGLVCGRAQMHVRRVQATVPNDGGQAESPTTEPADKASPESPQPIQSAS